MKERLSDFYNAMGIDAYEDMHLLSLREQCDELERQIFEMLENLGEHDKYIIEAYIQYRNDLEVESIKTAIRLGKRYAR